MLYLALKDLQRHQPVAAPVDRRRFDQQQRAPYRDSIILFDISAQWDAHLPPREREPLSIARDLFLSCKASHALHATVLEETAPGVGWPSGFSGPGEVRSTVAVCLMLLRTGGEVVIPRPLRHANSTNVAEAGLLDYISAHRGRT